MKLGAFVFAMSLMACAQRPAATPTSTTTITAAEITPADDAPKTGKAQHGSAALTDDDDASKPSKHDRKTGGGFSGYK